jgi:hypothetical protein
MAGIAPGLSRAGRVKIPPPQGVVPVVSSVHTADLEGISNNP